MFTSGIDAQSKTNAIPVSEDKKIINRKIERLSDRFLQFTPLATNEIYRISIAADVPDDLRPHKVYVKKEPGHVFLILEQIDTLSGEGRSMVWGFYPERPVSSVFLRNVRCEFNDNSGRTYDVSVTRQLTDSAFKIVREKAISLGTRKYSLNKYNCYDYAVEVFNSIPGLAKIPVTHVKFPFIFGRGGSPCGLYADLKALKDSAISWADDIVFGSFTAPISNSTFLTNQLP
jgi:hypothetical protein